MSKLRNLSNRQQIALGIGATILIVVASLVLFGGQKIDTSDLESKLTAAVESDAGVDTGSITVSCPDDIDTEPGTTFECSATSTDGGGEAVPISVSLQGDGSTFAYDFDTQAVSTLAQ